MGAEPDVTDEELAELSAAHSARLRELDPLLPRFGPLPVDEEGTRLLTVPWPEGLAALAAGGSGGPAGDPAFERPGAGAAAGSTGLAGAAVVGVRRVDVDSFDATWGALESYFLAARVAGPDPAGTLDALLAQWRAALPAAVVGDTAATVTWPSRDTVTALPLLRHGLAPLIGIAARPAGRDEPADVPAGVRIRPAQRRDLDALVAIRLATIRYDAQFGTVRERAATGDRLREHCLAVFDREGEWTWVAEDGGDVVGMVAVDSPRYAGWISGLVAVDTAAYVDVLGVLPGRRGHGAGGALLAHAHRALDTAGVDVTLLHYALPNPLSAPFYGRHGYRPLYTLWSTRPVGTLR